jgi:fido (protein-threonine AMPylation protein)
VVVHEIVGSEAHPIYEALEIANGNRHYGFLESIVQTSLDLGRPFLSSAILKALNFHAIACLHSYAGEFRPCQVWVGNYTPPEQHRVQAQMDDFINLVNRSWETTDAVLLASLVLWRLNHIHPFINGNGRTARAASHFVICVKFGGWLPGNPILPELLRLERDRYVEALKVADESYKAGSLDLSALHDLMAELLQRQIDGAANTTTNGESQLPPEED